MDHDFWHERWETGRINFHQGEPNAMLLRHSTALGEPGAGSALVPMCGKAVDMLWLARRGWDVLGVELSPLAVRDFFIEQGISAEEGRDGPFAFSEGGGVRLLCGDFFALDSERSGGASAVYDRAALVALPEEMRRLYADHLMAVAPSAPILLVTFEYPQPEADGPPFSVDEREVRRLFEPARTVAHLDSIDVLQDMPDLRGRGITRLIEHAFLLTPT